MLRTLPMKDVAVPIANKPRYYKSEKARAAARADLLRAD
jgi:hypothetical protein